MGALVKDGPTKEEMRQVIEILYSVKNRYIKPKEYWLDKLSK